MVKPMWLQEEEKRMRREVGSNLYSFARGNTDDIDTIATEEAPPTFGMHDVMEDLRERVSASTNHEMGPDCLEGCNRSPRDST